MTLFKYIVGQHYGWARTPLTSLLLRQGIVVCFLTFGELTFILVGPPSESRGLGMVVVNIAYESIRTAELELTLRNAAFAYVPLFRKQIVRNMIFSLLGGICVYFPWRSVLTFIFVIVKRPGWCRQMLQGCRLILDMRKLAVPHPELTSDEDYDIELTSNLDLSPDSTLACHNWNDHRTAIELLIRA